MSRILVPKAPDDSIGEHEGRRYIRNARPEDATAWFINEGKVYMHCHGVYGWSLLTLHTIDATGEVNASVETQDGVGGYFHEWVTLQDWPSNMRKDANEDSPKEI